MRPYSKAFPSVIVLGCWLLLGMALPAVARAADDDVSVIKLDRVGSHGGGWGGKVATGWEFETTAAVQVTELGIWDTKGEGLSIDTPVKLWTAEGKELASAKVPKGAGATLIDGFRYTKISPLDLEAGKRYVIAVMYTPENKDGMVSYGGANFSLAAPIRWIAARHQIVHEELTLPTAPKPARPGQPDMPGNFGPSFRIAGNKAAKDTRNFYRTRFLASTRTQELVVVPEKADGSHLVDKYKTISLYALADGKLTQVLFDDQPLGTGDEAFTSLAKQVKAIKEDKNPDRPILRVAAMSTVQAADKQRAVNVMETGEFDAAKPGREPRKEEILSLENHVMQPQKNGKFVAADRFKDMDEYIEDRWTGLLWQKDGDESGKMNYFDAFDYAGGLELSGVSGWRLPTPEECATIFPATYAPFTDTKYNPNKCCGGPVEFASYWTSQLDPRLPDYAFLYQWYDDGGANNGFASKNFAYVRCVHNPLRKKK